MVFGIVCLAFNVMYAYFNSNHASSNKTVPVKNLNNLKHAKGKGVSPQQMNQYNNVKSKTASTPKTRMKTSVPKPKQKTVKAVYKVKS